LRRVPLLEHTASSLYIGSIQVKSQLPDTILEHKMQLRHRQNVSTMICQSEQEQF
jgi:hypothetical protein